MQVKIKRLIDKQDKNVLRAILISAGTIGLVLIIMLNLLPGKKVAANSDSKAFVSKLYQEVLTRDADYKEMNFWGILLSSKQITGQMVANAIINSDEAQAQNKTDDEFLEAIYTALLNRPVDDTGKMHWISELQRGVTRSEILEEITASAEFSVICEEYGILNDLFIEEKGIPLFGIVFQQFDIILEDTGNLPAMFVWADRISKVQGTVENMTQTLFLSEEFDSLVCDDTQFIEKVFQAFYGRSALPEELAEWVSKLTLGQTTREVIIHEFNRSAEFQDRLYQVDTVSFFLTCTDLIVSGLPDDISLAMAEAVSTASYDILYIPEEDPAIASLSRAFLGTPYVFGSADPVYGFDCSGFIVYIYKTLYDIQLIHQTNDLLVTGSEIFSFDLQAGDLVCYDYSGLGGSDHVSLYIGDGKVIHASSSRGMLVEDAFSMDHVVSIRRIEK